jgi:alpha-tubulin suppressor-like RCC1 family protein
MVLTDDGDIYSWGAGKNGQLGHDHQVIISGIDLVMNLVVHLV